VTDPHALVGAYALDALTDEERAEFEAHLIDCADCRREVGEFRETLAETSVLTETAPPAELRGNVLTAIKTVRQLEPQPAHAVEQTAKVIKLPVWRRVARVAVAAVVAVALAIGGWAIGEQQSQSNQTARQRLFSAPDVQIYSQPIRDGASVAYVISRSENSGMAIITGRPHPGPGHVFQLWTMQTVQGKTQPAPDQTFSGRNQSVWLTGNVATAVGLAITVEPDGGSTKPTLPTYAVQTL
jgi:anti-sigma-K factor RskA